LLRACFEVSAFQRLSHGANTSQNFEGKLEVFIERNYQNVTENWGEIFVYFTNENINAVNIKSLINLCSALLGSNAPIVRVFSIINALWSDEWGNAVA
jgi:hypothetical protein